MCYLCSSHFVFFKQKTAYEMRISDWSSDVCSSDLAGGHVIQHFTDVFSADGLFATAAAWLRKMLRRLARDMWWDRRPSSGLTRRFRTWRHSRGIIGQRRGIDILDHPRQLPEAHFLEARCDVCRDGNELFSSVRIQGWRFNQKN